LARANGAVTVSDTINEKKARIISSVPKRYARKTGKPSALNRPTSNKK